MSGNIRGPKLPSDFAKEIAKSLGMMDKWVDEWFDIEEDKQGYFIAKLKPKKFLEKDQFRTICALVRDLGGEGYLQGMKAWKVPSPFAKKPRPSDTTSTRSKPEPQSGVAPDSLTYDKSKSPEIPNIKFIPVDAVKIPDFLPTRTLISHEKLSEITNSIKKHGLKYPIKVRRANNDYELIDGYLRLKSVQQLGWKGILAEIKDATDQEVVVESLITNKHRIEEDPITLAKKLDMLLNIFGVTQEKLAEDVGISQPQISKFLSLLKLPRGIQNQIALGEIGLRHALTLFTVNNTEAQMKLAKEITEKGLTVAQLEERIDELQPKPVAPSPPEPSAPSRLSEPSTEARRAVQPETPLEHGIDSQAAYKESGNEIPETKPVEVSEPKPEPLLTGFEVECPECHKKLLINHIDHPNGKISHEVELQ